MDDKPEWREVIETRLLPFQFVDDYFMIPQDPMGKDGPMLDQMLTKNYPKDLPGKQLKPSSHSQSNRQICPYLEKCTFGRKCKFYHPERDQRNETMGATASTPQNSMSPIGNRTPNASRSTTPSPSPEKWSHSRYSSSNRSSGEDLRQVNSNSGSTDDLTRYQGGSGAGMDLAELVQGLRIQEGTTPQQQQPGGGYYHQRPVPPNSMNLGSSVIGSNGIHSAPVFSTNSAESAASTPVGGDSQHLSHRYTFPMAVIPQPHHIKSSRTHILTEHHRLSSTLTPTQAGGGGGALQGIPPPPQPHEIGGDPNVMYSLQPHQQAPPPTGYASLQPDPGALSRHSQQQPTMPSMFMPRDSWHYSPHTAATPHELHPHGHGGSLMQAPTTAFYAPSQQQAPPDPPGYNSRAATATGNNSNCLHPHSVGSSSVIHVPSTHTSPYHHHHQSQSISQPQLMQDHLQHQHQHRHHSVDYGHPQNVSPHRKRSYSNDVHKQPNGHLPQVTSSPALMAATGAGGGPYNYDYQGPCSSTAGVGGASLGSGASGRPNFHGHQSSASAVFPQSAHLPPPPPPPSAPTHYNHRLPAVSESCVSGAPAVNMEVFRQLIAVIPGHEDRIYSVMAANPHILDIGELVTLVQQ